jgi:hypothetical protein
MPMRESLDRVCDAVPDAEAFGEDREALRLMLDYVAAECRRVGAADAARAAHQAALLLTGLRLHGALN